MLDKGTFKKCPVCDALVEKSKGCNFMTCETPQCRRSKTYFCFLCGDKLDYWVHIYPISHFGKHGNRGNSCKTLDAAKRNQPQEENKKN